MIAFVEGVVADIDTDAIIVKANGIGYLIYCPNPYAFQQYKGENTTVYTYQYVREDWMALYGFQTKQERALFANLLGVSGIGPKGALAILAACRPEEVAAAVEGEDERYLTKFPGVGKKTARQMILDLKGKLASLGLADPSPPTSESAAGNGSEGALLEAVEALKSLGYAEKEIQKVMRHISGEPLTTDQYVKKALQYMLNQ